ncbi:WD repeat-containing protein 26 [Striga asiatica]|uniref:WD repeat-containing protein 26 n=1 Tax=Striga asiatica TaxID=4170 RepID=A0A5A7PQ62_STRAF|nr:WD repeat-containing protein 26 [Striga asiatica]
MPSPKPNVHRPSARLISAVVMPPPTFESLNHSSVPSASPLGCPSPTQLRASPEAEGASTVERQPPGLRIATGHPPNVLEPHRRIREHLRRQSLLTEAADPIGRTR